MALYHIPGTLSPFARVTREIGPAKVPPFPPKEASTQPDTDRAGWTWIVVRFSDRISEHLQKLSKTTSLYLSMPMSFQFFGEDPKWWVRYQETCCWVEVCLGKASHSSSLQRASSSGIISGRHEPIANSTLTYINSNSISSSSQHLPI